MSREVSFQHKHFSPFPVSILKDLPLIPHLVRLCTELFRKENIADRQKSGDHPDVSPNEIHDLKKSVSIEQ